MTENENKLEINETMSDAAAAEDKPLTAVVFHDKQEVPELPYWKLWEVLLCFAAIYVISNFSSIFLYSVGIDTSWCNILATIVQEILTIILPFWVVYRIYGYNKSFLGFKRVEQKSLIIKAILSGIAYYFISTVILMLIILVYPFEIEAQTSILPILSADSLPVLIILVVITGFVAPIAEEIFFRGFLYAAVRHRLSVLPAALLSGLLFGLVHIDLLRLIPITVMGILLCLFYEKYKNIYLNILVHMGFNLFSLFLLLFVNKNV